MPDLFLSYRRSDAQGHAGRLYDRLREEFGEAALFYDQQSINPGELWSQSIDEGLRAARVVLALIAPNWAEARDLQNRRRLDVPEDVVRRELAAALQSGKLVIPVLIDEASIPRPEELPTELRALAGPLQIHRLQSRQDVYNAGVTALIRQLRQQLGPPVAPVLAIDPEKLPYLCDRSAQEEDLRDFFDRQQAQPQGFRRPLVCLVPGVEGEAHDAFLERLQSRFLPRQLELLGLPGRVEFYWLRDRPQARDAAAFAREFRRKLWEEMQIRTPCLGDEHLRRIFEERRARLIAPVLTLSSREAFAGTQTYFEILAEYWQSFPDLPEGLLVISFVSLKLSGDRAAPPAEVSLQARIRAFADQDDPAASVLRRVIPPLESVLPEDVSRWSQNPEVSARLPRRLSDRRLRDLFGDEPALPMDDVIDKLTDLLMARGS